jgi:CBS domain containing-hemolysin-like protein
MEPLFYLVVVVLIALNAVFVTAEFALVGTPPVAASERARRGGRWARELARLVRDPRLQDRYIATAQLGITGASLALGMYAEHELAVWIHGMLGSPRVPAWLASHGAAATIAVLGLSYLHIVLGEMVPKAIALADPLRAALFLAPLMRGFELLLMPAVLGLNFIGNGILKLFGIQRRFGAQHYTAEELQHIVWESEESGLLGAESAHVLAELVEFGQLTAGEAMIPRVQIRGIEVGASKDEIARVVRSAPHTRYPVYAHDLDHIIGMIHIKDLVRRLGEPRPIRQADIRKVPYLPATSTLDVVLETMRHHRVEMAVVMDEHGGTDGVITTEDLFEEVIGDIQDEVSAQPPDRHAEPDGTLIAAGTVRVDEVGEHFDLELEHDEVDTMSGLVLALLDRPPVIGDQVTWRGLRVEVSQVEGHGVARCRVRRATEPPPSPESPDGGPKTQSD